MSEPMDLPATAESVPEVPFCGGLIAEALQDRYRLQRAEYRAANPDRTHEIDSRCAYLAPPELRVRIGGME